MLCLCHYSKPPLLASFAESQANNVGLSVGTKKGGILTESIEQRGGEAGREEILDAERRDFDGGDAKNGM